MLLNCVILYIFLTNFCDTGLPFKFSTFFFLASILALFNCTWKYKTLLKTLRTATWQGWSLMSLMQSALFKLMCLIRLRHKTRMSVFGRNRKIILKFRWNLKGFWISKTIWKKQNKVQGFISPNFKIYWTTIIKTVWC